MELYRIETGVAQLPPGAKPAPDLPAASEAEFQVGKETFVLHRDAKSASCRLESRGKFLAAFSCPEARTLLAVGRFDDNDAPDFALAGKGGADLFYFRSAERPWWTHKPDFYRQAFGFKAAGTEPVRISQPGMIEKISLSGPAGQARMVAVVFAQAGGALMLRSAQPFGFMEFQSGEKRRDLYLGWIHMGLLANDQGLQIDGVHYLTLTPSQASQEFFLSQVRTPEF